MNAETVVSIITGNDSDSDWNDSGEEQLRDDSLLVDKLSMELGKMATLRASVTLVNFVVRLRL